MFVSTKSVDLFVYLLVGVDKKPRLSGATNSSNSSKFCARQADAGEELQLAGSNRTGYDMRDFALCCWQRPESLGKSSKADMKSAFGFQPITHYDGAPPTTQCSFISRPTDVLIR
ncbi:unnamed protein product [Litomosoides sigmodontis]|uniref:Uncharacterized protein n=1 Tax=Litomosoides sigmodontis TaxID=42156 RepID=A0A3P6TIH8_LITSI|nr:unnamed protein product [Litomosoides sigmodontis]